MRKLVAVTQMTLDGVMQALGGPEEDPRGSVPTSRRVRARFVSWSVYGLVKLPSFEGMGTAETKAFEQGDDRMETKMNRNDIEPKETATPAGMSDAARLAGVAPPETGGRVRSRLVSGWRFTRHLLEMVLAMMVGMAVFGLALAMLGDPPGYANLLVQYGLIGAFMAAPMVAWMRHRRHSWRDSGEMTAAMLAPMLAPVVLVELGVAVPGLSEHSLMMLSHVAMIGGMVALMIYRFERYAHGLHDHHDEKDNARTARTMNAKEARR